MNGNGRQENCSRVTSTALYSFSQPVYPGKWKTRKAGTGTGTETETEIRKRSSDLKVSIARVDGNSMQVCSLASLASVWYGDG